MGEILINQLFAGNYLQEGNNIGHEIINLFRDDNDANYLFITPSGTVNNHSVDKVLFVQNIKARETMEVVMKAEVSKRTISSDDIKNISYAGTSIIDIFNKNIYKGEKDLAQADIMVTYEAEDIRFPKKDIRIIITVDPLYTSEDKDTLVYLLDPDKDKIVGQGMRTYLSEDSYTDLYDSVQKLIDDETLWEDENTTQKMIADGSHVRRNPSFLEIIRKENDELIMSNLLAYYFKYDHGLFVKFTEEVLGLKGFTTSFEIIRESMENIDIWIRDEKHILVIENKIKSGLNGHTDDGQNQLNKYFKYTENYKKKNNVDEAYYYLFVPNHNDLVIDDEEMKEKFKVVNYSTIYDFFSNHAVDYLDEKYFTDFMIELKKQTMNNSELRFSMMRSRLLEKINQK